MGKHFASPEILTKHHDLEYFIQLKTIKFIYIFMSF